MSPGTIRSDGAVEQRFILNISNNKGAVSIYFFRSTFLEKELLHFVRFYAQLAYHVNYFYK